MKKRYENVVSQIAALNSLLSDDQLTPEQITDFRLKRFALLNKEEQLLDQLCTQPNNLTNTSDDCGQSISQPTVMQSSSLNSSIEQRSNNPSQSIGQQSIIQSSSLNSSIKQRSSSTNPSIEQSSKDETIDLTLSQPNTSTDIHVPANVETSNQATSTSVNPPGANSFNKRQPDKPVSEKNVKKKRQTKKKMSIKTIPAEIKRSFIGKSGDAKNPQIILPPPYVLPTVDRTNGILEKPVSMCMPIARPASDFPLSDDQKPSAQMGENPPPRLDKARATFSMELHNHYNHYARIHPTSHIGIRNLMPDHIYHHLICCLQDPLHLPSIKQSDQTLFDILSNFVKNNRLQLFHSVVKAGDDDNSTTIVPVLYAFGRHEQRSQPDRPVEGERSQPNGCRIIPISQVPSILKHCYQSRIHRGGRSTSEYVRAHYSCIPHSLIILYRQYDPLCVKATKTSHNSKPQLKPILASKPRERYTLDLVDKSATPDRSNSLKTGPQKWIIHLIDHATKMRFASTLPNKTPVEIVRFLTQIFSTVGRPDILQCDNGTEFKNSAVGEFCRLWGVKQLFGRAYKPTTQGVIERANRTLQFDLRMWMIRFNGHDRWQIGVATVVAAANQMKHRTTGKVPMEVWTMPGNRIHPPSDEERAVVDAWWHSRSQTVDSQEESAVESAAEADINSEAAVEALLNGLNDAAGHDRETLVEEAAKLVATLTAEANQLLLTSTAIETEESSINQSKSLSTSSPVESSGDSSHVSPSSGATQEVLCSDSGESVVTASKLIAASANRSEISVNSPSQSETITSVPDRWTDSVFNVWASPLTGNDAVMVSSFDRLMVFDGSYWNDLSPNLASSLKRRGGLAAGQCAPHSFLNSTVGTADHDATVALRSELHSWLFDARHGPSRRRKLDELIINRVEVSMEENEEDICSAQLTRDLLEECQQGSDNIDASLHTLRALCLRAQLNLYVVTLHHLTKKTIILNTTSTQAPKHSSAYQTNINCRFYSFDNPGEVTFTDQANTIAIYQSIFETRTQQVDHTWSCRSVGHFESLQDDEGFACWTADDPIVVFVLERCVQECERRNTYYEQVRNMKEHFDRGQQPVQLTIGQLALLSPPSTFRRDQITNRHYRANVDDMCVRIVAARPSSASFFAYKLEAKWGILSEEWFHHELRGCGIDVDAELSSRPMPSPEVLADKQSHVSVSAAWTSHLQTYVNVNRSVLPIDRLRRGGLQNRPPAVDESATPCVHCGLRDGVMHPCAGCFKPIHITPCGTLRKQNQRITVGYQVYHTSECYNAAATQDADFVRTRAGGEGLSSENLGSARVKRTRAQAKKQEQSSTSSSATSTSSSPTFTSSSAETANNKRKAPAAAEPMESNKKSKKSK